MFDVTDIGVRNTNKVHRVLDGKTYTRVLGGVAPQQLT
jgi:hypothetical protein